MILHFKKRGLEADDIPGTWITGQDVFFMKEPY
jgi:hypothetical protein